MSKEYNHTTSDVPTTTYKLVAVKTLFDRQREFDDLRKRTAITCYDCSGLGIWYATTTHKKCYICKGECEVCAYCQGHSKSCTCGEDQK